MLYKILCCLAFVFPLWFTSYGTKNCGKESGKRYRISGGAFTKPHQYPWMVFIPYYQHGQKFSCGGALISDRHILTAKHCIKQVDYYDPILIGAHKINEPNKYEERKVEHTELPRGAGDTHDIGIIVLKSPVNLNDPKIGIICLPQSPMEDYKRKRVVSMGWGMERLGAKNIGNTLKHVHLIVDSKDENEYLYTKVDINNGIYQDPCSGDSGGPLIYKEDGRWIIIGTVNGGGYDCRTGKMNGPGKFNKVTHFLPWIKRVIGEGSGGNSYDDYHLEDDNHMYINTIQKLHHEQDKCRGRRYGGQECCDQYRQCNEGEGDCDDDDGCIGDLICKKDNCIKFGSFFDLRDDCCQKKDYKL